MFTVVERIAVVGRVNVPAGEGGVSKKTKEISPNTTELPNAGEKIYAHGVRSR